MKRAVLGLALIVAAGSIVGVAKATQQPPALPAPIEDRVGFPEGYQTDYTVFYVFDRPDNKQVRVIYANDRATAAQRGQPFPYGSILVMETYRAKVDADGNPELDAGGRYQRGELTGIFVMRKEPGFGEAYEQNRTGEWEYVAFRPDRSYLSAPPMTASCAVCHGDTQGRRDWTFRTDLSFSKAGALPSAAILNYTYLPETITVKAGGRVTWSNEDPQTHTVTAADGGWDSGRMLQGAVFSRTFDAPGSYAYACTIHPAMKGAVVVAE